MFEVVFDAVWCTNYLTLIFLPSLSLVQSSKALADLRIVVAENNIGETFYLDFLKRWHHSFYITLPVFVGAG